ncbi:MAG: hypothetical protein GY772_32990 [bacterium]|nr:hypothetical protein [bacterium]
MEFPRTFGRAVMHLGFSKQGSRYETAEYELHGKELKSAPWIAERRG